MCIARENLVNEEAALKQKQSQSAYPFVPNNWTEPRADTMVSVLKFYSHYSISRSYWCPF